MFIPLAVTAILARIVLVHADPTPTAPGPGSTFKEGGNCSAAWDVDTSGLWTTMNIEFMSGSNLAMNYMTTVATVDATDPATTSVEFACPNVTPNSAIYFLQFTSPSGTSPSWSTRFAIADASGNTTPPPNATQPNGDPIPWGVGTLIGASSGPEPAYGQNASSSVASASGSSVGPPASYTASSGSSSGTTSSSPTSSNAASVPSGSSTSAQDSANAAVGALAVDGRVFRAAVALAVAAFTFAVAL